VREIPQQWRTSNEAPPISFDVLDDSVHIPRVLTLPKRSSSKGYNYNTHLQTKVTEKTAELVAGIVAHNSEFNSPSEFVRVGAELLVTLVLTWRKTFGTDKGLFDENLVEIMARQDDSEKSTLATARSMLDTARGYPEQTKAILDALNGKYPYMLEWNKREVDDILRRY
jgi:hypothetical protein